MAPDLSIQQPRLQNVLQSLNAICNRMDQFGVGSVPHTVCCIHRWSGSMSDHGTLCRHGKMMHVCLEHFADSFGVAHTKLWGLVLMSDDHLTSSL